MFFPILHELEFKAHSFLFLSKTYPKISQIDMVIMFDWYIKINISRFYFKTAHHQHSPH